MFKNSELSNEIASSLHGKLNIVKNADAHVKKSIFKEALEHLNEAADLLDRSGNEEIASFITGALDKFADEYSPFADYDVEASGEIDELQNQINALSNKDATHVQGILESNGFDVEREIDSDSVRGHRLAMGDEPELHVVASPDTEPGMGGHWVIEVDEGAESQMQSIANRLNNL